MGFLGRRGGFALIAMIFFAAGCGSQHSQHQPEAVATITHNGATIEISRAEFEHALALGRLRTYPSQSVDGPRGAALADLVVGRWLEQLAAEHGIETNDSEVEQLFKELKAAKADHDLAGIASTEVSSHLDIGSAAALQAMTDHDLRAQAERAYVELALTNAGVLSVTGIKRAQMRLRSETKCLDSTALTAYCENGPPLFDARGNYAN